MHRPSRVSIGFLTVIFCSISFVVVRPANAQTDLTGYWDLRTPNPTDGTFRDTYIQIQQTGDAISGMLLRRPNGIPISGSFKEAAVHFATVPPAPPSDNVTPPRPPMRPIVWDGTFKDGKLALTVQGRYGTVTASGERVTKDATLPPAPLPLPALKDLPDNGLARTPPMGWNSWNKFAGKVNDTSVREMADAMVSSGMSKAGYIYINIDDTWELV
jgi:alpha-galactosidase